MFGLWWFYMVREFIEGVGYIKANFEFEWKFVQPLLNVKRQNYMHKGMLIPTN